jgi:serine/threonine protein kinase
VHHGDIKPANILLDARNTPFLIDFLQIDVQRFVDLQLGTMGREDRSDLTEVFGTIGFMDEDQERYGIITPATDTYSLGMTFAHLFRSLGVDDDDHDRIDLFAFFEDDAVPGSLRTLIRQMTTNRERPTLLAARTTLESLLRAHESPSGWRRIRRFFSR